MAKQLINLGTAVNDGTGDALRVGAEKINENFTELYDFLTTVSGQLGFVSSIIPGDGIVVSANSGTVQVSAKTASSTELGTVKVGNGLQISLGGVLSFNGSFDDLTSKPDMSLYQLVSDAFSGQYSDLQGSPNIPSNLSELGISPGQPGDVLVSNGAGSGTFTTLFDQSLTKVSDVIFNSVQSSTDLIFETSTAVTEQMILSYTGQKNSLETSTLPSLQNQADYYQSQLSYWSGIVSSTQPGSPEWENANNMLMMTQSQLNNILSQISSVQGQIYSLASQIGYLENILSITTATVHFDHPSQSLVFSAGITTNMVDLLGSNSISTATGIRIVSADDTVLTSNIKSWTFGADGKLMLPLEGDIVDASGNSVITTPFDQTLNTTDNVTFNSVSAAELISTSAGVPELLSSTNINLTAANAVVVTSSPFRLASLTTAERDALTAVNGDMIYNITLNKFQGYQNGAWVNLDGVI